MKYTPARCAAAAVTVVMGALATVQPSATAATPALTNSLTSTTVVQNGRVNIHGSVKHPARCARSVVIQQHVSGVWHSFIQTSATTAGSFSTAIPTFHIGTLAFRAYAPARCGYPIAYGPALSLTVKRPATTTTPTSTPTSTPTPQVPGPILDLTIPTATDSGMTLTWSNPTAATGITLCRSTSATATDSSCAGATALPVAAGATSFTDTGLTKGAAYHYTAYATNAVGASTAATTTATAVGEQTWLDRLNALRTGSAIPAVTEATGPYFSDGETLAQGIMDHLRYMATNGVFQHGESSTAPGYTADGSYSGMNSVLALGLQNGPGAIDAWVGGDIGHEGAVLNPSLTSTAFALLKPQMSSGLNVYAYSAGKPALPLTFPGNGATVDVSDGNPDTNGTGTLPPQCIPPSGQWFTGLGIFEWLPTQMSANAVVTASMTVPGGATWTGASNATTAKALCVIPNGTSVIVVPQQTLANGTYTITVSISDPTNGPSSKTWSFTEIGPSVAPSDFSGQVDCSSPGSTVLTWTNPNTGRRAVTYTLEHSNGTMTTITTRAGVAGGQTVSVRIPTPTAAVWSPTGSGAQPTEQVELVGDDTSVTSNLIRGC